MAKRKEKLENAVLYVNRTDENLYKKVKFLSGIRDCTVREIVEEALTEYLKKTEGVRGERSVHQARNG